MTNYVGLCNLIETTSAEKLHTNINLMSNVLNKSNEENFTFFNDTYLYLSYTNDSFFSCKIADENYSIIFNGNVYNLSELKEKLISAKFNLETSSTAEIVLKLFIHYGCSIFKELNGTFSFAIWQESKKELVLCRDHLGVKPLYYTILNDTFIFSTDIKPILKHPEFKTVLDKQGICELLGIGPAHTSGTTIFKNIFEIKPAHYGIFNSSGFKTYKYWNLQTYKHIDNFETTCNTVKYLLEDSINKQIISEKPISAMLSGGIDSSILVAYVSNLYKKNGMKQLETLSVDYLDNDKNFVKSDFQPNSDNYYINIMKEKFNTNHHNIIIDTPELADSLESAMNARTFPGMADVDSSILLFSKKIKDYTPIALSGECSDEIFAGYPWFFREDALNSNTFPWSLAINERQNLLNSNISKKINLKDYIDFRYNESIKEVCFDESDSKNTREKRIISHLTVNWFMQTLLDRADRMCGYAGLEVRIPFCDYRLVQYMWNIPWDIKAYNNREKGLLRHIVKDLLPDEIVNRKKSPYPKTHNPNYLKTVKEMLCKIMQKNNSPINNLLNKEYILEILNTDGKAFTRPWFGQLMTGPQLIAYLVQVNMWLEKYNPKIEI